ncbi:porphobilinogen synthase [Salibacterium halotolerans]|uniref:Delta-aminolevulinic acid dehydratase n=1 Tax=Salibacterium halotolerans TaxID=1884432 RepID=A0A1I5SS09_9BACI|nr:porphobilinogen synthase [Salibacterium halotolerans]SFP73582.1 porphobilinogen synthase [Salibacterium halotolerans]
MNELTFHRHRRLRSTPGIRNMVRETVLRKEDLIFPIFVLEGSDIKNEVPSMPGVYQVSLDHLGEEMNRLESSGVPAVIVFGIPEHKDENGTQAYAEEGIVQKAIRQIKQNHPDLTVIADTCLCQYTDHGHCGIIEQGTIVNDTSLDLLTQTAVSQADAGADIIAPSNMMDGFTAAIRHGLDEAGHINIPVMSYSVKFASAFYGPFRDAAHSSPSFGDRKTYQMDPPNRLEALREAASDVEEGADFLIVKPALPYLDVVREVKDETSKPVVAYNVSGEYAMIKAASANGWLDEKEVVMEKLTSMKRAGADLIVTYFAIDAAAWIDEKQ